MDFAFPNRCWAEEESFAAGAADGFLPNDDFLAAPPVIPVGELGSRATLDDTPLPIGLEKKSSFMSSCTWPSLPLLVLSTLSSSTSMVNRDDWGAADSGASTNAKSSFSTKSSTCAAATSSLASSGACSNNDSSTVLDIFFTTSPPFLPPRAPLAPAARGRPAAEDLTPTVAAAVALLFVISGFFTSADAFGESDASSNVGLPGVPPSARLKLAPVMAACTSFSSCLLYSCAARLEYLPSILSLPISSHPCCLKNVRPR
mmetsp:Transcript_10775/g.30038  ORF Transcript_10775/g.30038 Transcript_10775/m.30038 type:complete len:259 (+) Transcript_10775:3488-4264(+)